MYGKAFEVLFPPRFKKYADQIGGGGAGGMMGLFLLPQKYSDIRDTDRLE